MKQSFRPVVTALEERVALSSTSGIAPPHVVERMRKPAPRLKGTLTSVGSEVLTSPVRLSFFLLGKLGKVRVTGRGFLLSGDPVFRVAQGYDYIQLDANKRSYLTLSAITEPLNHGGAAGPVTLRMQVTEAAGIFAADLGAIVSVSIVPKPHKGPAGKLSVTITPSG